MGRTQRQKALRARRAASLLSRPGCPTPQKRSYATNAEVVHVAVRKSRFTGKAVGYYQCPCGAWHVKTPKKEAIK